MSLFLSILLCIACLVLVAIGYRMGQSVGGDFVRFLRMQYPDRERLAHLNAWGQGQVNLLRYMRSAGFDKGVMDLRFVSDRALGMPSPTSPIPSLLASGPEYLVVIPISHSDRKATEAQMHKAWVGRTHHFRDRNSGPYAKGGDDSHGGGAGSA